MGDWILAICNPYGLGGRSPPASFLRFTAGSPASGAYDRYIQTDAAINMGNSGGPMFDLNGNVIGINSALISPTGASVGIGLATPVRKWPSRSSTPFVRGQRPSLRLSWCRAFRRSTKTSAPALGIHEGYWWSWLAGSFPMRPGARVRPPAGRRHRLASTARLVRRPTRRVSDLVANTAGSRANSARIICSGKRATVYVQVAERPTEEQLAEISGVDSGTQNGSATSPTAPQRALGLSLAPLTPELARAANLPPTARGVVITSVDPNERGRAGIAAWLTSSSRLTTSRSPRRGSWLRRSMQLARPAAPASCCS